MPGKLGRWFSKPFDSAQKAIGKSGSAGRRGRGKMALQRRARPTGPPLPPRRAHLSQPPLMSSPAMDLMQRLGLSDDELCEVLAADPISVLTNELSHRPELLILLDLTAEAAAQVGDGVLRRWLRRRGPNGVPFEHLRARDFAAFEDDLDVLAERGFVLGG